MENGDMTEHLGQNPGPGRTVEFRFAAGPNNGAALRLEPGEYFIGNTPDSEVVFALDRPDSIEFVLGTGESGEVYARSRSGSVYIYHEDGSRKEELSSENTPVPEGARVGLDFESLVWMRNWAGAGSRFRMISEDEIAALSEKARGAAEKTAGAADEAAPDPADPDAADAPAAQEAAAPDDPEGSPSGAAGAPEAAGDDKIPPQKKPLSRKKQILGVTLGLGILLMLLLLQNFGHLREFLVSAAAEHKPMTIREYVDTYPEGALFLEEKNNSYLIKAAFRTEEQRQRFLEGLPGPDKPLELRVRLIDEILDNLRNSFDAYGIRVNPVPGNGREIALHGYIRDQYIEADVMQKVKKDLPYLYEFLVPKFSHRSDIEEEISALTKEANLEAEYYYGRGYVVYNGMFSMDDLLKIKYIAEAVSKNAGGPVWFRRYQDLSQDEAAYLESTGSAPKKEIREVSGAPAEKITAGPVHPPGVPAGAGRGGSQTRDVKLPGARTEFSAKDVQSVNIFGKLPFFRTRDGAVIMQGARLPDGAVVKEIRNDSIVLEKNRKTVTVSLR